MSDLERLGALQRKLLESSLETAPRDVTRYKVSATNLGDRMPYKVQPAFVLNDEAVATLREISLLLQSEGNPIRGLTAEMSENDDDTWGMVMEFDYA